jgi:hypothetical protein
MGFFGTSEENKDGYELGANFNSPLLNEIKDPQALKVTYNKLPIVPFFGNNSDSSDVILSLIYKLIGANSTAFACVNSIARFTTGAGFDLLKQKRLINLKQETELSDNEIINFEDELNKHLLNTDLINIASFGSKTLSIDGNYFIKVTCSKISKQFKIEPIDTNKVRYTVDKSHCIIANSFLSGEIIETPPQIVPTYPNFDEDEFGLIQTIIHVKDTMPNRSYYGLASSSSSILDSYQLNQLKFYLSAETDNRFTGRVFFDSELGQADNEEELSKANISFLKTLNDVYTTKNGKRKSVLSRFRPNGVTPTNVTQFEAQTGERFYEVINQLMTDSILRSFGWDGRLIGSSSSASMAANEMPTIFKIASNKVKSNQQRINMAINTALSFAGERLDFDFHKGLQLSLGNLYNQALKEETEI